METNKSNKLNEINKLCSWLNERGIPYCIFVCKEYPEDSRITINPDYLGSEAITKLGKLGFHLEKGELVLDGNEVINLKVDKLEE